MQNKENVSPDLFYYYIAFFVLCITIVILINKTPCLTLHKFN